MIQETTEVSGSFPRQPRGKVGSAVHQICISTSSGPAHRCPVPAHAKVLSSPPQNHGVTQLPLALGLEQPCSQLDQAIDLPESQPYQGKKRQISFQLVCELQKSFLQQRGGRTSASGGHCRPRSAELLQKLWLLQAHSHPAAK